MARGFTRSQQGKYRPLVASAWKAHADAEGIDSSDKEKRRAWYVDQLAHVVGVTSTKACDRGRDFDALCAHFEALSDDGSTYWQQRAADGELRRILNNVFAPHEPHCIGDREVDETYCRAIAKQSLQTEDLPHLHHLSKPELQVVTRSLKIAKNRTSVL